MIGGIMATLRQHGGRATSARRLLLEALIRAPGHQTADELTADVGHRARGEPVHHLPQP